MPMFEKRNYIALAKALHKSKAPRKGAEAIATLLTKDNENFDRERFLYACKTGIAPGEAIDGGPAMPYYQGKLRFDPVKGHLTAPGKGIRHNRRAL